jgi:uncharacterized protein YodC (DUF2158 family)
MSAPNYNNSIAPGTIVYLHGIDDGPEMFVLECDRTAANCVWFNRNSDLSQARFPIWALKRANEGQRDSGELAALSTR